MIVVDRKARSQNSVLQARKTIVEAISIETIVKTINFNIKITSTVLEFLKSIYQRGKLIRTINLKMSIQEEHFL